MNSCGPGTTCNGSQCVPTACGGAQCGPGTTCVNNQCVLSSSSYAVTVTGASACYHVVMVCEGAVVASASGPSGAVCQSGSFATQAHKGCLLLVWEAGGPNPAPLTFTSTHSPVQKTRRCAPGSQASPIDEATMLQYMNTSSGWEAANYSQPTPAPPNYSVEPPTCPGGGSDMFGILFGD